MLYKCSSKRWGVSMTEAAYKLWSLLEMVKLIIWRKILNTSSMEVSWPNLCNHRQESFPIGIHCNRGLRNQLAYSLNLYISRGKRMSWARLSLMPSLLRRKLRKVSLLRKKLPQLLLRSNNKKVWVSNHRVNRRLCNLVWKNKRYLYHLKRLLA